MLLLHDLPVEIIQLLGQTLLESPSDGRYGSAICSLIRTSSHFAIILTPVLLNAALRSTVTPSVPDGANDTILISHPPEAIWKSLSGWKSQYVQNYFRSLPLEFINSVVFYRPKHLRWKGRNFANLLQKSIQAKNKTLIQCLIDHGADIHGPNLDLSPLREAIDVKNIKTCRALLEMGAGKVQKRSYLDPARDTPLSDLTILNEELANLLIDELILSEEDFDLPDIDGYTPLFYAARVGKANVVLRLLSCGATILGPLQGLDTGYKHSVLAVAVDWGAAETSSILLDDIEINGKQEFTADANGENAFIAHKAVKSKLWDVLERLIKLGIQPDCEDSYGGTLLERIAQAAHSKSSRARVISLLQLIEERTPEFFARPQASESRGSFAAYINDREMSSILYQKGLYDQDLGDFDYKSLFDDAFPRGNPIIETLKHSFSFTPFRESSARRDQVLSLLEYLINEGVSLIDPARQETALHAVLYNYRIEGFSEAAELLLKYSTPEIFELINHSGDTILTLAIRWHHEPKLPNFLAKMSRDNILLRDRQGNTALTYAAQRYIFPNGGNYRIAIIDTLLKACPELLHARDADGNTPLHHFAHFDKRIEEVKFLHDAGASLSELNDYGEPPFHGSHGVQGITTRERESERRSRYYWGGLPNYQNQLHWDPAVSRFFYENGADLHRGCKECEKEVALLEKEDEARSKGKEWRIERHEPQWT